MKSYTHHELSLTPKYGLSKNLNNSAKVHLLLKDDQTHFLSPEQRADLLSGLEEKYEQAKKKKARTERKAQLAQTPKIHISQLPPETTPEQIMKGLKDGTIVVG